jgi:hypothetical protein
VRLVLQAAKRGGPSRIPRSGSINAPQLTLIVAAVIVRALSEAAKAAASPMSSRAGSSLSARRRVSSKSGTS